MGFPYLHETLTMGWFTTTTSLWTTRHFLFIAFGHRARNILAVLARYSVFVEDMHCIPVQASPVMQYGDARRYYFPKILQGLVRSMHEHLGPAESHDSFITRNPLNLGWPSQSQVDITWCYKQMENNRRPNLYPGTVLSPREGSLIGLVPYSENQ